MITADRQNNRLEDEASFFDRQASATLNRTRQFKLTNTKTHVELFGEISHLKGVVPHFGDIQGKRLLDLACGDGWTSLYFARSGAEVHCCDISSKCIELAQTLAEANCLSNRITAEVMNAEEMDYSDARFDFVFVNAGLHHCHLKRATDEIKRVLKPGGKLAMLEDYGHHPLFTVYRFITRHKHTKYEKALTSRDVAMIAAEFEDVAVSHHGLLNVFGSRLGLSRVLETIDRKLISWFPFLTWFARLVQINATKGGGGTYEESPGVSRGKWPNCCFPC